jgi:diguanylate cyclase (GGDEF)-like protein
MRHHTHTPKRLGQPFKSPFQSNASFSTASFSLNQSVLKQFEGEKHSNPMNGSFDLAQKELECARLFNFEMSERFTQAIQTLESVVAHLSGTTKNVILIFNEASDTYLCLNDQKNPSHSPRELTLISDGFLKKMLDTEEEVIHTDLYYDNALIGIVAVAEKQDHSEFTIRDEITLELMARYLSVKVFAYKNLKESLSLPFIQNVTLEISNRLIAAMDSETILTHVMDSLSLRLGIDVCQYISLDGETGEGLVFYENTQGKLKNYTKKSMKAHDNHPKIIEDFASLVSLFSSMARRTPFLQLTGKRLGDKLLADMFGVKNIESALMIPVMDVSTNKPLGVINLFLTQPGTFSQEVLEVSKQVSALTALAISRASALQKAIYMATCDELTGLTNRRGFYERFEVEIERARRNPASLCVAMIDVDYFKRLNDTYGHLNGDLVLQQLATLLLKNVRKSDLVCRFGGEEFVLLLPDTPLKAASDLVERIRRKIQKARIPGTEGLTLKVSISAGVTEVKSLEGLTRSPKEVISESLALADEQLYLAKEHGRNQVFVNHLPCEPKSLEALDNQIVSDPLH